MVKVYAAELLNSLAVQKGSVSIILLTNKFSYQGREIGRVTERDPAWRAGGTTLQGYSTQQFMTAEPIKVDPSRKVELVLRLVAR